uniref:Spindle assembly abnormal protein 6 N-terminal domain-containing protein n=1 Tax=Romanomermis culicivorax TaxID=13658 RepID=A0A915I5U3_ROMCU
MGEVIGSNGGIEIECWREIVPVVFHEARRMTVHIQFRSIKFSLSRREFHIKLSSEEDHCFLYKTAVTQDVYQRFAHYHSLDVPFEQFSEYMHHLIHSVKNNQDYGDRFFINILAPQTPTHLPHSIEFIITQGQMGCLVQCKRLSLAFTLASDAELKEHLMSCFERLEHEKDMAKKRCSDLENELSNERAKVKELHERNRYFQRELEFSQTLIKSAETIQFLKINSIRSAKYFSVITNPY